MQQGLVIRLGDAVLVARKGRVAAGRRRWPIATRAEFMQAIEEKGNRVIALTPLLTKLQRHPLDSLLASQ